MGYYEKSPFYGNHENMHYRVFKQQGDTGAVFHVDYWPGPYIFAMTEDDKKLSADFEYSEAGLDEITGFLKRSLSTKADLWKDE